MTQNKQNSRNINSQQLIADQFRIVKSLGKGGQGEVYLVEDIINNNCHKALKTLCKEILPQNLQRFKREVAALKSINSRYILSIESTNLDSYQINSEETPYYVTKVAKHGNLREHNYYIGEIELSLKLFRDICEGVMVIHKAGIIHRDLKPSNILLVENEKDIHIGDFGLCYIDLEEDEKRATKIRETVGPIFFAAPEQTSLPPNFTQKSDIYSLGRILYFLVTGHYEFKPGDEYVPITIKLGINKSHPIDTFIQKLISFEPKNRPDSVKELILEIDKLLKIEGEESSLELSDMQRRIIKYLKSFSLRSVSLKAILEYLANFYGVDKKPYSPLEPYTSASWSNFADSVDNSLEQLEEAGLIIFEHGEYRCKLDR